MREVPLGKAALTLGRAPSNDIVLTSRFVSAKHARIEPDGGAHRIVNLGSMNGLLRAGRKLPEGGVPPTLGDGDVLRIGDPTTGSFVTLVYRNPVAQRARSRPGRWCGASRLTAATRPDRHNRARGRRHRARQPRGVPAARRDRARRQGARGPRPRLDQRHLCQ